MGGMEGVTEDDTRKGLLQEDKGEFSGSLEERPKIYMEMVVGWDRWKVMHRGQGYVPRRGL